MAHCIADGFEHTLNIIQSFRFQSIGLWLSSVHHGLWRSNVLKFFWLVKGASYKIPRFLSYLCSHVSCLPFLSVLIMFTRSTRANNWKPVTLWYYFWLCTWMWCHSIKDTVGLCQIFMVLSIEIWKIPRALLEATVSLPGMQPEATYLCNMVFSPIFAPAALPSSHGNPEHRSRRLPTIVGNMAP